MPCHFCVPPFNQEYDQKTDEATRERRKLDIEVEETEDLKKQRLVRTSNEVRWGYDGCWVGAELAWLGNVLWQAKAEKEETLKQEIKAMNKVSHLNQLDCPRRLNAGWSDELLLGNGRPWWLWNEWSTLFVLVAWCGMV